MTRRRARAVALAAVPLLSGSLLAACTSSGHGAGAGTGAAAVSAAASGSTVTAQRWWSNAASERGSAIDARAPLAAVSHLRPSRADYCGMLRQTVAAGRSILPGVTATDPALLTSTRAFVGEVSAVAPPGVAPAWKVVGSVLVSLVQAAGASHAGGVDPAATTKVAAAAGSIASDAEAHCHLDLSRATPSPTAPSK